MTRAARLDSLAGAVRKAVTGGALGNGVGILYLAWRIRMVHFMAEGTLLLMSFSLVFQEIEDSDVALGALLHCQRLNVLVEESGAGRHLFDFLC